MLHEQTSKKTQSIMDARYQSGKGSVQQTVQYTDCLPTGTRMHLFWGQTKAKRNSSCAAIKLRSAVFLPAHLVGPRAL